MKINIITLFPSMFSALNESIVGRAIEAGILELNTINPRDYSENKHRKVDDYTFGGGQGMVMTPQPLFNAIESNNLEKQKIIYMSPRGKVMDAVKLGEIAKLEEVTVLCGHYEGIDQRVLSHFDVEELSIGDYVLTGGELACMVMIDACARFMPGVLGNDASVLEESIYSGLLEYPQYTQPRSYEGIEVPEVLLSGNHQKIRLWRLEQSLALTAKVRPDLLSQYISRKESEGDQPKDEKKIMEKYKNVL